MSTDRAPRQGGQTGAEPRLAVDWIACNGYGLCAAAAPDLITLDDWGYPILPEHGVTHALLPQARKAINDCPMLALTWEGEGTGAGGRLGRLLGGR